MILKLPDSKYKVTDPFGKIVEMTESDFNRYVESTVTPTVVTSSITKADLQIIKDQLLTDDVESALNTIDSLI